LCTFKRSTIFLSLENKTNRQKDILIHFLLTNLPKNRNGQQFDYSFVV